MALKEGDFLLINYTIKIVEGPEERVYDTTIEEVARKEGIYDASKTYGETLVVLGKSTLITAVEEALKGMKVGEKREIIAAPEKAYGERREDLVVRVPLKQLRRLNITPRVGQEIYIGDRRGRIVRITERFAYIDFNHPLAGKRLKISLELVRKIEEESEKAKYLAARQLNLASDEVEAKVEGDRVEIRLPNTVLGLPDLESMLQVLSRNVHEYLEPRRLDIVISVSFPEKAEKEARES